MIRKILLVFLIAAFNLVLFGCKEKTNEPAPEFKLVDKKATPEVIALFNRIKEISKKGIAVGHQDDTSYGLGWKHESIENVQSDVQKVTGDFPAVFGFDIGWIEVDSTYNLDTVPFNHMRDLIIDAHKRKGIVTISWHANNPVTGGSSWDKTPSNASLLKNGANHALYEKWVNNVAAFLNSLEYNNVKIPVVFRPYHEMNGSWFWWGGENTSKSDYKKLWIETVELLKDKHNIHHLLYAFSPNKFSPGDNYLDFYPGDAYVDILGMDIYDFNDAEEYKTSVIEHLAILKKVATEKNKPYAFTETGLESLKTDKWFTEVLYPAIKDSGIAWVLTWRNYDTKHHYMPYNGHKNEQDFINFKNLPNILFLKDIQDN